MEWKQLHILILFILVIPKFSTLTIPLVDKTWPFENFSDHSLRLCYGHKGRLFFYFGDYQGHKGRLYFILMFDLRHSCSLETGKTLCLVTRQWLTASLTRPITSVLLVLPLWVCKGFILPTPGMLTSLLLNVPDASLKSQNNLPVFVSFDWR